MLNAALGMLAMVPVVFGVGGYVLVNRRPCAGEDDDGPRAGAPNGVSL
jgi:hypothetical protein